MRLPGLLPWLLGLGLVALPTAACATPVGVVRGSSQETHLHLTTSVLSAGKPSAWPVQVLNHSNLAERFQADPEATLQALREPLLRRVTPDRLFALAELSFLHAQRQPIEEAMFFEPLPAVERVVFIATPHRGSYRATGWALNLVRRFVALPGRLVDQLRSTFAGPNLLALSCSQLPTSVDDMGPSHHFIRTLADSPIDPRIAAHSIIAVRGPGPPRGQTDGVVVYESAHVEGVASEVVVRSGHSTRSHPDAIAEVRRILREHAEAR